MDVYLPIFITILQVHLIYKFQEIRPSLLRATCWQNCKVGSLFFLWASLLYLTLCQTPSLLSSWISLPSMIPVCLSPSVFRSILPPRGFLQPFSSDTDHLLVSWHSLLLPKSTQMSIWELLWPMLCDLGAWPTITKGKGATSAKPFLLIPRDNQLVDKHAAWARPI